MENSFGMNKIKTLVTSEKGIALIKSFEGIRLKAYKDPGSKNGLPITIGYGSTMYTDGRKIKLGDVITKEQAEEMLRWEVKNKSSVLRGLQLPFNQNQFDALTSFVFNIGVGNFLSSTLLKRIKVNVIDPDIKNQFSRWIYNDGKVLDALVKRRKKESDLYFKTS